MNALSLTIPDTLCSGSLLKQKISSTSCQHYPRHSHYPGLYLHHALLCRCHAVLCWLILITPYPATALRDPGHALQGPYHYRNRRRLTPARTKSRKRLHADEGECIQHCATAGAARGWGGGYYCHGREKRDPGRESDGSVKA